MNQDDQTDQEISDNYSEDTTESIISFDIKEDDWHYQLEVLHLGMGHQDKSLCTTRVRLPLKLSHADTVIARPPLSNSQNLPAAIAPPLLKR
jgi:hypothetical protein